MRTESPQTSTPRLGSLRADQVNLTRERIIEAFVDQVAGSGFDDFSIERVARRAGVSPRTIYHHFPRRDDLLDAVNQRLTSRFGMEEISEPLETEDLLRLVERVFRRFDDHEPLIRAQLISRVGRTLRDRGRSKRLGVIQKIVDAAAPHASAAERKRAAAVVHYLTSSETWRALKDEAGLDGAESGQAVAWTIRALLHALSETSAEAKERQSRPDGKQ